VTKFVGDDITTDRRYPNFDLAEWLRDRELEFKENNAEDHLEISMNCTECENRGEPTPDTKQKLWVNVATGFFTCYRCGFGGSMIKLISSLGNTSMTGALRILRGRLLDTMDHLDLKLFEKPIEWQSEEQLREVELPHGYQPIEGPHPYLKKRGIPWKYAAKHDWGISTAGYTKDRLIVPTFMNDRLVFWQARATWESDDEDFKKVLNPKGVSARSVLYNYDVAKHFEEIVIVEGFIDAVKVGPNAVATNGKRLHERQVEWLEKTKCKRIVLLWDRDSWTDQRVAKKTGEIIKPCSIIRAAEMLKSRFRVRAYKMPKGRDPGGYKLESEELAEMIAQAKPV